MKKKPCPYCGKRLKATSKGRWRNNLARHLESCQPYNIEMLRMTGGVVNKLIDLFFLSPAQSTGGYIKSAQASTEVRELERMYQESPNSEPLGQGNSSAPPTGR